MKKWLHTAMSSIVSIRMQLQERACCGVPCRMPLILGESISSYPGASFASPFSISRYVHTHIQCISYSSCAVISAVQHLQECLKNSVSSPLITFGFHILFRDELGCEIFCLGFRILLTKNFEETWTEILLGTSSLWSILVLYLPEKTFCVWSCVSSSELHSSTICDYSLLGKFWRSCSM
jgi:hypothetical protein